MKDISCQAGRSYRALNSLQGSNFKVKYSKSLIYYLVINNKKINKGWLMAPRCACFFRAIVFHLCLHMFFDVLNMSKFDFQNVLPSLFP